MRNLTSTLTPLSTNRGVAILRGLIEEAAGWPMCGAIPMDTVRNVLGRTEVQNLDLLRPALRRFDETFTHRDAYLTPEQVRHFALEPVLAAA